MMTTDRATDGRTWGVVPTVNKWKGKGVTEKILSGWVRVDLEFLFECLPRYHRSKRSERDRHHDNDDDDTKSNMRR